MKFPSLPRVFSLILFAFFTPTFVSAAAEYTSFRDIMQDEPLRRDFMVQGEYLAKIGNETIGLQVIADGSGNFRFVAYVGGLPGDGWKPGEPRFFGTGELAGDEFAFTITKGENASGDQSPLPEPNTGKGKWISTRRAPGGRPQGERPVQDGARRGFFGPPAKIEISADGDIPALTFEKTFRRSPTLGERAPEGATVIFDGTGLDMFNDGAKMNEMNFGGQNNPRFNTLWADATSKAFEENKPYKLHLEFLLSYMPEAKGQARSNSGVYVYQSYECQVLDSFGLEGENNECGGFYTIAKPAVNMCFPPMTWQTYDFEFTPPKFEDGKKTADAKLTLKHNGVTIHEHITLPGATPGCLPEAPGPRGLYLQGHGNKVQYRNIWVQYQ